MTRKPKLLATFVLAATALCIGNSPVWAQIVITDFTITDSSVTLSVTGSVGGPEPFADHRQLFLLPNTESLAWSNSTIDAGAFDSPIANNGSISAGSRNSFSIQLFDNGVPALNLIFSPSGGPNIGDAMSGSLESTWDPGTFVPSIAQSDTWSLYWGRTATSLRGGTLQSTITPVPEPTEFALAASIAILAFAIWQRKRKNNPSAPNLQN